MGVSLFSPNSIGVQSKGLAATNDPYLPAIECKIQSADRHASDSEKSGRDVGIYQLVEVVEQKSALVWFDARFGFQPVL